MAAVRRKRAVAGEPFRTRFPGVAEAAAAEFGFDAGELLAGGKLGSFALCHARAIALWIAHQQGDVSYVTLATLIGMNYPSVRARVKAIALRRQQDRKFRSLLERVVATVAGFAARRTT